MGLNEISLLCLYLKNIKMYHFGNQQIYHHNNYEQCSIYNDHSKLHVLPHNAQNHKYASVYPQEAVRVDPDNVHKPEDIRSVNPKCEKVKNKSSHRTSVDTSSFSIEERLVAAVWVHERKQTNTSMSQIKHDFRQRFGREPPAKNTFLVWERKLFSTGSVCDAPRPGRLINRRSRVDEVAASMRSAPGLSLRARAVALRLPRTTLKAILCKDLAHTLINTKNTGQKSSGKQQVQTRKRQKVASCQSAIPHETPPVVASCALPHLQMDSSHTRTTYA